MKTTKIRGNDYVTVNERVKYFRSIERYDNCAVNEEIVKLDENQIIVLVTITESVNGQVHVLSQAHAQEFITQTGVNKTSFLENAMTSALGRALGYLGIGIDAAIASKDEVENAKAMDKNMKPKLSLDQFSNTLTGTKQQAVNVLKNFSVSEEHKKQIKIKFKL